MYGLGKYGKDWIFLFSSFIWWWPQIYFIKLEQNNILTYFHRYIIYYCDHNHTESVQKRFFEKKIKRYERVLHGNHELSLLRR